MAYGVKQAVREVCHLPTVECTVVDFALNHNNPDVYIRIDHQESATH